MGTFYRDNMSTEALKSELGLLDRLIREQEYKIVEARHDLDLAIKQRKEVLAKLSERGLIGWKTT